MRNLMPITRPMGAADLTQAAEEAGKMALALSDLARGVAAYEAATGAAIAVVDADKAVMIGVDLASGPDETVFVPLDKTLRRAVEDYARMDHAQVYRDALVMGIGITKDGKRIDPAEMFAVNNDAETRQDAELLDAMYPQPVPEAGTIAEALTAGADLVSDVCVNDPRAVIRSDSIANGERRISVDYNESLTDIKMKQQMRASASALPKWQGKGEPPELRDAVEHIAHLGPSGPKWGFAQDLDMMERALDGQTEKLIADVMEFSQSHVRQRFNKLVDRTHAHGNRFTREQVRDALRWMLAKDEMPAS